MTKTERRRQRSERRALQTRPSRPRVPKGGPEAKAADQWYAAEEKVKKGRILPH
jgi:hypothetical protein